MTQNYIKANYNQFESIEEMCDQSAITTESINSRNSYVLIESKQNIFVPLENLIEEWSSLTISGNNIFLETE